MSEVPTTTRLSSTPVLTKSQSQLLDDLGTSYTHGLPTHVANARRGLTYTTTGDFDEDDDGGGSSGGGGGKLLNVVPPPINCPPWVCCLLPCIGHMPSMKSYKEILPDDAEVLREGEWVCYDASSLVRGDIIRLREGDRIPADCVVLNLFPTSTVTAKKGGSAGYEVEMIVDLTPVVGGVGEKPLTVTTKDVKGEQEEQETATATTSDEAVDAVEKQSNMQTPPPKAAIKLFFGGIVLDGCCVAVVTETGRDTVLADRIRMGMWPPGSSGWCPCPRSGRVVGSGGGNGGGEDEEVGISLLSSRSN